MRGLWGAWFGKAVGPGSRTRWAAGVPPSRHPLAGAVEPGPVAPAARRGSSGWTWAAGCAALSQRPGWPACRPAHGWASAAGAPRGGCAAGQGMLCQEGSMLLPPVGTGTQRRCGGRRPRCLRAGHTPAAGTAWAAPSAGSSAAPASAGPAGPARPGGRARKGGGGRTRKKGEGVEPHEEDGGGRREVR